MAASPCPAGLLCMLALLRSAASAPGIHDSRLAELGNARDEGIGQVRSLQENFGTDDSITAGGGDSRGMPSDSEFHHKYADKQPSDGEATNGHGGGLEFPQFELVTSIVVLSMFFCCLLAYACAKCRQPRTDEQSCKHACSRRDARSRRRPGGGDGPTHVSSSPAPFSPENGLEEGKPQTPHTDESRTEGLDDIVPSAPDISNEGAEPQVCAGKEEDNAPHTCADSQESQPQSHDIDECIEQLEGVMPLPPATEVSKNSEHKAQVGNEDEAKPVPALQKESSSVFSKASGFQFSRSPGGCVTGIVTACGSQEMFYGKPSSFGGRL